MAEGKSVLRKRRGRAEKRGRRVLISRVFTKKMQGETAKRKRGEWVDNGIGNQPTLSQTPERKKIEGERRGNISGVQQKSW